MEIIDKIKGLFLVDSELYEDDMEDDYEMDRRIPKDNVVALNKKLHNKEIVEKMEPKVRRVASKSVAFDKVIVKVLEPKEVKDSKAISDALMDGNIILVNMESAKYAGSKQRILDFISGAVYTENAELECITDSIYLIVPHGVLLDSPLDKQECSKEYNNMEEVPLSVFPKLD